MAETKVLKGINFPGLEGTYYVPEATAVEDENGYIEIKSYVSDTVEVENLDTTLTKNGYAADANAVGSALYNIQAQLYNSAPIVIDGDGSIYTATVEGITSLEVGMSLIIIPNVSNTSSTPTLNINNLGAKLIVQRLIRSNNTGIHTLNSAQLQAGTPVHIIFDGQNWLTQYILIDGDTLYGNVPVTKGGTGAWDAATARANLGAAPAGFGLGSTSAGVVTLADIDGSSSALIPTGWYRLGDNLGVGITIDGVQFNPAQMRIESDSFSGQMSITLFRNGDPIVRRSFIRGIWNPWEWINPPMEAGVEYRTTQRWNGKPLYKKLVPLGSVSNGASIEWHDKTNVIPIRYDAHFYAQTVPKYNSASSYLFVHLAANIAAISCAGYTNSPVVITIDYVYSE